MRILGIDHIGIASGDLGKHIEIFGDKLGLEIHDVSEVFRDSEFRVFKQIVAEGNVIRGFAVPGVPDRRTAFTATTPPGR